jgi:AcrR family transcriptional regulator
MMTTRLQRRREPSQARGHERVRTLLEATGQLLEDVGYDALTTKAIAERARTSIGSFYQFFPNRDAAVAALVEAYRAEVRDYMQKSVRAQFAERHGGITADWVGSVVGGLRALYRSFPGFGRLFAGNISEGSLRPHADALRTEILESLEELMGETFPEVDAEHRHRCLLMVVETARSVMSRLPQVDAETGETLRSELEQMLALYMSAYFERTGPRREAAAG